MARAQRKNNVAGKINTFTKLLLPIWSLVIHRNHTEPKVPLTNFSRISTKITGLYPSSNPSFHASKLIIGLPRRCIASLPMISMQGYQQVISPVQAEPHSCKRSGKCMHDVHSASLLTTIDDEFALSVLCNTQLFSHFQGQIF